MAERTSKLANKFAARCTVLESTRVKMETVLSNGDISVPDIEQVYAGLFLDVFTEFEALIEDLFLGLLMGKLYSSTSTIRNRKLKITPTVMVRDVLFGGKPYLDWLPYPDYTIPRAKRFFQNGEPFTLLDETEKSVLKVYHSVRNAIAHKSESARSKFQNNLTHLHLFPRERTPAGYLRSQPSASSSQTQYEIAVVELERIARKLCS